jgi:hypothetical protein
LPAATPLPTLSQVQNLDTGYLSEAADYFERTGNLWDEVFAEIHEKFSTPGGTAWEGQAAAAAQERASVDVVKVRGVAFQLHEAAGVTISCKGARREYLRQCARCARPALM